MVKPWNLKRRKLERTIMENGKSLYVYTHRPRFLTAFQKNYFFSKKAWHSFSEGVYKCCQTDNGTGNEFWTGDRSVENADHGEYAEDFGILTPEFFDFFVKPGYLKARAEMAICAENALLNPPGRGNSPKPTPFQTLPHNHGEKEFRSPHAAAYNPVCLFCAYFIWFLRGF